MTAYGGFFYNWILAFASMTGTEFTGFVRLTR